MPDPITGEYGRITYTDYTDNWRSKDTTWFQSRMILRYADVAARDTITSPGIGQPIYVEALDRMQIRSKTPTWMNVLASDGLVVDPVLVSGAVKLYHKDAAGAGFTFTASRIKVICDFEAADDFYAQNAWIKTSTAGITAKLSTSTTALVCDSNIVAPSLTVNVAAPSTGLTCIGNSVFTGILTANGGVNLPVGEPSAAQRAPRKDWVDTNFLSKVANAKTTGYIQIAPASGNSCLYLDAAVPQVNFRSAAGSTTFGYINADATKLYLVSSAGDITLNSGGGQVRTSDAIYCTGASRFYAAAQQVICIGTDPYIGFYNGTSVDAYGTRAGYVGFTSDNYMHIMNEQKASSLFVQTDYAIVFSTSTDAGAATPPAPTETMRIQEHSGVTINGTAFSIANLGHSLWNNGTHYSTTATGAAANIYLNRINGVSGDRWMYFERSGAAIGSISQNGTTGTLYNTSSDYRQKTVVGPIDDALDRVMRLQPWRVTWNDDPDRGETDAFIANELAEVIPDAVTGEMDAVFPIVEGDPNSGQPLYQQVDYSTPVPLLTAAIQAIVTRLELVEQKQAS